ncbi:MAG TPA: hypothetical protein VJA21_02680 [Verrucomicrobiae bacterium]
MKTNLNLKVGCAVLCAPLALIALLATTASAGLPEPDNLLYGSIRLDNALVTAARTDVVIEARRTLSGPAISRYRMGTSPAMGDLYVLRLQLESVPPIADPNSSQISDTLFVVVTDGTGLRAQTGYTIAQRGVAQRVDFGVAAVDADGDGLPDAWELLHFAHLGQTAQTLDVNGQTAGQNYIAGTNPNDTNDVLRLSMIRSNDQPVVSFLARSASGVGYEGRSRYYALETCVNPAAGDWTDVPEFALLPGKDELLLLPSPRTNSSANFRVRVWLQP